MLLVVWHACVLRRLEDYERTRRRENPGEGQGEARRAGEDREEARKRAPTTQIPKFFHFCILYSIVFHSVPFGIKPATVYDFYFYYVPLSSIPFHLGGGLCLGLYLACTLGCTLLLDHFWLLLLLLTHTDNKIRKLPPQNKINTARRRRRRGTNH